MNNANRSVFIIHQMHLSRHGQIKLEGLGWEAADPNSPHYDPEIAAYADKSRGAEKFKPDFWKFYHPAMKVVAKDLDGVFEAGNGYGPRADEVEKLGKAYSCSVGDIIQCGGLYWMVDPCGFSEVAIH